MDNVKICVYAICKNELQFVDKWIDSMSEADYIVVLDTGSTDGTYEKLKADKRITKVKKKVIKPWRFDVARNESMKLIPSDTTVCVCTDLDELFEPNWADKIRNAWTENTWRGHYRYVWSHTPSGNPDLIFSYDKIHTLNPKYKWYYPVHEVLGLDAEGIYDTERLEVEGQHGIEFGDSIVLHHYPDHTKERGYYFELLNLRVAENGDAFSMYLLGREYGVNKQYEKALEVFDACLNAPDIERFVLVGYHTLGYMGDCYNILNNTTSAITCYQLQISRDATHLEPYVRLGGIYEKMGMYRSAIGFIEDGLAKSFRHYDWAEDGSVWNGLPEDLLSICYWQTGNKDKALEYVVKAMQKMPEDERIRNNYLSILNMN